MIVSGFTADGKGFYVQYEGGGEWSGMYIYAETMGGDFNPLVGDKVNITGTVSEFYDSTQVKVSTSESIQVVGEGDVAVADISGVTDWEVYESVLIGLSDQTVVSAVNDYGEVQLSEGLMMDNVFLIFQQSMVHLTAKLLVLFRIPMVSLKCFLEVMMIFRIC